MIKRGRAISETEKERGFSLRWNRDIINNLVPQIPEDQLIWETYNNHPGIKVVYGNAPDCSFIIVTPDVAHELIQNDPDFVSTDFVCNQIRATYDNEKLQLTLHKSTLHKSNWSFKECWFIYKMKQGYSPGPLAAVPDNDIPKILNLIKHLPSYQQYIKSLENKHNLEIDI